MTHENLIKELRPVGKYRIRILDEKGGPVTDIREYISDGSFEGYTRRGVRLAGLAQINLLREILDEIALLEWPKLGKEKP